MIFSTEYFQVFSYSHLKPNSYLVPCIMAQKELSLNIILRLYNVVLASLKRFQSSLVVLPFDPMSVQRRRRSDRR